MKRQHNIKTLEIYTAEAVEISQPAKCEMNKGKMWLSSQFKVTLLSTQICFFHESLDGSLDLTKMHIQGVWIPPGMVFSPAFGEGPEEEMQIVGSIKL